LESDPNRNKRDASLLRAPAVVSRS
jgi:hypothetical protein